MLIDSAQTDAFDETPIYEMDGPELVLVDRFTRAQRFRERALEQFKSVSLWADLIYTLLEHEPLNDEAIHSAAVDCAGMWNEALNLHAAFKSLIDARGSA